MASRHYTCLSKIPDRESYAAWDLETEGLGGVVLAASYCLEGFDPHFISGSPADIIHRIVDQFERFPDRRWYAHNAQYDWRYLFSEFDLREYKYELVMRTDNDVFLIQCETKEGTQFTLVDSLAFYAGTLASMLKTFAPGLPKLSLDFDNVVFDPANKEHRAYALRDAEGLVTALANLDAKLVKDFSTHLGYTTASTAVKAWRHTLTRDDHFFNDEANETFIRSGYFGGLVFLTTTHEQTDCVTMDINSSYPHIMRSFGVPYGGACYRRSILWGKPGLYRVRVYAPETTRIPILPLRQGRLVVWPRGEFVTTVTTEELEFAIAHGYEILEVIDGLAWSGRIYPFNDFVDKTEAMRKEYKGMAEEKLAKLMQNSLSGKFGTRRERRKIFRPRSAEDCLGATPWGIDERFWYKTEYVEDLLCLPQWVVYITAQGRLALLRKAYAIGCDKIYYGDTDSLTLPSKFAHVFSVGDQYGQWKAAHTWSQFRAIAPKVYAGVEGGEWQGAIKGIPQKLMQNKTVNLWPDLYDQKRLKVEIETLPKFVQFLKRERWGTYTQARQSSLLANSASWVDIDGQVWPRMINPETKENKTCLLKSASSN